MEPWTRHRRDQLHAGRRLTLYADQVTRPDGQADTYEWVAAPDAVRVAALLRDDLVLVEQHHYLPGARMWQLPGGVVEPGESPATAARRELAEETGLHSGRWTDHGTLWPLPSLTPVRVHLFVVHDPVAGPARPDPAEADLRVLRMPLTQARKAARQGRVGCAPSAALILAVDAGRPYPS